MRFDLISGKQKSVSQRTSIFCNVFSNLFEVERPIDDAVLAFSPQPVMPIVMIAESKRSEKVKNIFFMWIDYAKINLIYTGQ